jgi:large subunit ribosomal protein L9
LAVVATDGAIKQSDAIKQAVVRREAKTRAEAEELAQLIEKVTLTFQAKAGEGDRLFGSITSGDIVDALAREKGITVDKRKLELVSPLKELGNHSVAIKLHPEVTANVMVVVERQTA